MKLKIGDKVRIKPYSFLKLPGNCFGIDDSDLKRYAGKIIKIDSFDSHDFSIMGNSGGRYWWYPEQYTVVKNRWL